MICSALLLLIFFPLLVQVRLIHYFCSYFFCIYLYLFICVYLYLFVFVFVILSSACHPLFSLHMLQLDQSSIFADAFLLYFLSNASVTRKVKRIYMKVAPLSLISLSFILLFPLSQVITDMIYLAILSDVLIFMSLFNRNVASECVGGLSILFTYFIPLFPKARGKVLIFFPCSWR